MNESFLYTLMEGSFFVLYTGLLIVARQTLLQNTEKKWFLHK